MKEQQHSSHTYYDSLSSTHYSLQDGKIIATTDGGQSYAWPVPIFREDVGKSFHRSYLKFTSKSNSHVLLNPTSTLLVCKSERVQEVDTNKTYLFGQAWWQIFVPHTTLYLTVGIKDKKTNKLVAFDFSLKYSAKLSFKLNLQNLTFKTWINGIQSQSKPALKLEEGCSWTPFVRVRQIGSSISLNPFVSDPQEIVSNLNFSVLGLPQFDIKMEQNNKLDGEKINFEVNQNLQTLKFIAPHTLMLTGQKQAKFIRRNYYNHQFSLDTTFQTEIKNETTYYLIALNNGEHLLLKTANQKWQTSLFDNTIQSIENSKFWMKKTKEQWLTWTSAACKFLDSKLLTEQSQQLVLSVYELLITKFQELRNVLQTADLRLNNWSQFDLQLVQGVQKLSFHSSQKSNFLIQPSVTFNNYPALVFPQKIIQSSATQNYAFFQFEANKITVVSIRGLPVKVGDFILSKAIKKENELTEYQKQAEQINNNDLTKPSIYKILKNCLKYADKVKPPEKLVKELENKRNQLKQKEKEKKAEIKKDQIIPDKSLENTLIQMGFQIKIARMALIECKNSSLEAAMDLILSKTLKVEETPKMIPKSQWTCQTCTLVNDKNALTCVACESPVPIIEFIEEKNQQKIQLPLKPIIQEEIQSDKIEEPLKKLFPFETNIALSPLVIGGVFESKIRFRLFCLNPKFYSYFYQKNDAYVDLTSNSINQLGHQLKTSSIQDLALNYFGQAELKQKKFAWIPVEDYDLEITEEVNEINYTRVEEKRENLIFRIDIVSPTHTKTIFLNIDTSKVYLEKAHSLSIYKGGNENHPIIGKDTSSYLSDQIFTLTNRIRPSQKEIQFQAHFAHEDNSTQISEVIDITTYGGEIEPKKYLPLYVVRSSQVTNNYPHISLVTLSKLHFKNQQLFKNGLVLGHLQNNKLLFESFTIQVAHKEHSLSGFIYLANDYELQPLKKYRFNLKENTKQIHFKIDKALAFYVIIVLDPQQNKTVELSQFTAYGEVLNQYEKPNPRQLKVKVPAQNLKINLIGQTGDKQSPITSYSVQSHIINPKYDLSLLDQSSRNRLVQKGYPGDLQVTVTPSISQLSAYKTVILSDIFINKFTLIKINTKVKGSLSHQSQESLRADFNSILEQYLHSHQKSSLQKIISIKYSAFKEQLKNKNLQSFILDYVTAMPYNSNQKRYAQFFFKYFESVIVSNRDQLNLPSLIQQGLLSQQITTNGLQLLINLNRLTQCLSCDTLASIAFKSMDKIAEWKLGHEQVYSPYAQTAIFSPHIHKLMTKSHEGSITTCRKRQIDEIHHRTLLKKYKFSKKYLIDLLSVYSIRQIQLAFQRSDSKNKIIVSMKWFNSDGTQVDSITNFYDYSVWKQLVSSDSKNGKFKNSIAGYLSLDLENKDIKTRYVIIEINYTLRPFNASKAQIQNIADNEVIPIVYGTYIGEQQPLLNFGFDYDREKLKFVKKIGHLTKFSVANKSAETSLFEEDDLQAIQSSDLESIKKKLQIGQNKEKYVSILMKTASNKTIDFHYTMFTVLLEELIKTKSINSLILSQKTLQILIQHILNKEASSIQQICLKFLKVMNTTHANLYKNLIKYRFSQNHISYLFKKQNPLSSLQDRKFVLSQLKKNKEENLILNVQQLLKIWSGSQADEVLDAIGSELINHFQAKKQFDRIGAVCTKLGWIQGVDKIMSSLSKRKDMSYLVKHIVKTAKKDSLLTDYLLSSLKLSAPTQNTWSILSELAVRSSQNHNIAQIDTVFKSLLEWVNKFSESDESQMSILPLIENIMKFESKFKLGSQVFKPFVKIYFSLDSRSSLLSQFLKLSLFSTPHSSEILLKETLSQLTNYISKQKQIKISKQSDDYLRFVVDILSFIFKQSEGSNSSSVHFSPDLQRESLNILSFLLINCLNLGGNKGCRHMKQNLTNQLLISFYLSKIISQVELTADQFQGLLKWYIININHRSDINPIEQKIATEFNAIRDNVWQLIVKQLSQSKREILKITSRIMDQILESANLIDNSFLVITYELKVWTFLKKLLQQHRKLPILERSIHILLKEDGIFRRLLRQISQIKSFDSEENKVVTERELANQLKLLGQTKPKDWLVYKSGSKNHVHEIEFIDTSKNFKTLIFESESPFWLSHLTIGFECDFAANRITPSPSEIMVEVGWSLDEMSYVGRLQLINSQIYDAYSIKVNSINLHRAKGRKFEQGRNKLCNFVKLTIKSPYLNNFHDLGSGKQVSYISFLSIQGYIQNGLTLPPSDVSSLVENIQILSTPCYKSILTEMLSQVETVATFKASLLNISYLMNIQVNTTILHNFLLRVCQLNSEVGDEMLSGYLQLKNPYFCSKIAAQIVLSNLLNGNSRVSRYFTFIIDNLESKKDIDKDLLPFVDKFTQIVTIVQQSNKIYGGKTSALTIKVTKQLVQIIIEKSQSSRIYLKFATFILSATTPFSITGFDLFQALNSLFLNSSPIKNELLACLITTSQRCRDWFIERKHLEELFKDILLKIQQATDIASVTNKLKFLTLICESSQLKGIITKLQYDLQIFQILINKKSENLLSNVNNKEFRERLVEFIAKASLGSQNQRIIGALLKDSLNSMDLQNSQQFIAEIFLPLLNSYSKATVNLIPFSQSQNKILMNLSSLKVNQSAQKVEIKQEESYKLFSNILSNEEKSLLFQKIRSQSLYKWGTFTILTNHGKSSTARNLEAITAKVARNSEHLLLLFQSKESRFGLFYNSCKGSQGFNNRSLQLTKGSFFFKLQGKQIKIFGKVGSSHEEIISLQSANKKAQGSQIEEALYLKYRNQLLAEVHFNGINASYFYPQTLTHQAIKKTQTIEIAEYWTFDPSSIQSYQSVFISDKKFAAKLLAQFQEINLLPKNVKADGNLELLRYGGLYEFPSSITIKQLKSLLQIMNCRINQQKLKTMTLIQLGGEKINQSSTLENIIKNSEREDMVIDILVDLDNTADQLQSSKTKVQFLPKKGILKYFEENDGVKTMIRVIKKSIGEWKNVPRRQKWIQYVTELQKFSSFPHFFSVYLKDKDTFTLLLNLLSGLPDKQTDTKWDEMQASYSQKLLKIIEDILKMDKTNQFRNYALANDFVATILERLRLMTGIFKRKYQQTVVEEENSSPTKNQTDDDGIKKIKKKKGVGYGNDTNSNTKWMKGENMVNIKKDFENIETILNMIESFLNVKNWPVPKLLVQQILESALLPYTEDCLRAGTLLQISKHPEKFKAILNLIRSICNHQKLVVCFLPLSANYQPSQSESIESLLRSLCNTSKIFISCLNQNVSKEDKLSQELATDIIETYNIVEEFIQENRQAESNEEHQKELLHILELQLDKKYRELMKDLRFDYIDMKESPSKIKHHYASNFTANYTPNQNKMIRLAQQLADISTALPYEHTNAVYVRCDKDRIDFMQALIMGSNGTPYGHGAFLFDIYFQDTYPNGPPKVNLTTTGHGKIRFNPNLYACGKVCLSLLGTWRGSASENWEPKVSTLLQVLLSIQAIIMSEEVYFNEPGFENEQGTEEGEKKNEAYSNIVRYGNVKFAMLENIRNPPKGFESIIRRHFYLKRDEIMEECRKWIKYAEKRPANYVGLVNDHNVSWAAEFKKTKTQYKEMLQKAVKELEEELYKLPPPKTTDLAPKNKSKKIKKKKEVIGNAMETLQNVKHEEIDVSYQIKNLTEGKELDINDEKVKDRWSRYIGAMGIDAVNKQSKADILVFGLGPFALEAVKNLVLSGCRKLTLCDDNPVTTEDLSGGFFYQEEDRGKNRLESILYKIRQLNSYVKVDSIKQQKLTAQIIQTYTLVLATELNFKEQVRISKICREKNIKFMSADCRSAYCRLVNDFGEFTVLDKNGEEPVEVMIKDIQISEKGLVTLLDGVKHPYEDGEVVVINGVEGMENKQDKTKSINSTIHTIKVATFKSFEIGNTLHYSNYIRNGTSKNIKTPVIVKFRPFEASIDPNNNNLQVQSNLETYDFTKLTHAKLVHTCFITLDLFVQTHKRLPEPWNIKQTQFFLSLFETYWKENLESSVKIFVKEFVFTCRGNLPPLCAFFGGLVAQEVIKGITQKYKPINSTFYIDFSQVIPKRDKEGEWIQEELNKIYLPKNTRDEGFAIVVGTELLNKIKEAKLFMIGAGAIGCELLKNFAMVGLGTGSQGKIVLTDPDHIQNSNLNRQFLFREKHISKPKSLTAAASILLMNPYLKGHISPLLERVSDATKDIFNNKFFESLTVVANALDNVAARRYVDQRCVENKVPLFESGTLGPKGHVQVIIPYLTESYGSQNDPVEEGQIPHCTLKLFPEETLHCIQWARDNFGKKFTLQPKALAKFLEKGFKPQADDIKSLNQSLTMINKGPHNFEDCIYYAITKFYKYFRDDILQLMYTYPLDAKTKNGEPFWRLPKRPPTAIMEFNPTNILHCTFVSSLAVLLAKMYQLPFPKDFRTEGERLINGKKASKIKIPEFVPSDQKAQAILKETVADQKKEKQKKQGKIDGQEQDEQQTDINSKDQTQLYEEIISTAGKQFCIKAEQFQKDDDSNGHIDYIYAMANLRATNYKLEPMDWMTTKLKAGRIIPALSTTTSCVAGLQTLQICKYIQKIKIADMRNSYLNLAVPSLQMSEPGQVKKTKITEKLVVSIWDRWELQCKEDITFGEVYEKLHAKYGLFPKGVLQGMSRIDVGKSEHDKKSFLKSIALQKLEKEDDYVDIAVLFTLNEQDDKILEDIPAIRLFFSKK